MTPVRGFRHSAVSIVGLVGTIGGRTADRASGSAACRRSHRLAPGRRPAWVATRRKCTPFNQGATCSCSSTCWRASAIDHEAKMITSMPTITAFASALRTTVLN